MNKLKTLVYIFLGIFSVLSMNNCNVNRTLPNPRAKLPNPVFSVYFPVLYLEKFHLENDSIFIFTFYPNYNLDSTSFLIDITKNSIFPVKKINFSNANSCKSFSAIEDKNKFELGLCQRFEIQEDSTVYEKIEWVYRDGGGRSGSIGSGRLILFKKSGEVFEVRMPYYIPGRVSSLLYFKGYLYVIATNLYDKRMAEYLNPGSQSWLYVFKIEEFEPFLKPCKKLPIYKDPNIEYPDKGWEEFAKQLERQRKREQRRIERRNKDR